MCANFNALLRAKNLIGDAKHLNKQNRKKRVLHFTLIFHSYELQQATYQNLNCFSLAFNFYLNELLLLIQLIKLILT